jgi:hypothetical protein
MSAAQACGDFLCPCGCGAWLGQCLGDFVGALRLRPPPKFYLSDEIEPPFPTTPPGVLTMSDSEPPITNREPKTEPDMTPHDSYFDKASKDFAVALVELRETRGDIRAQTETINEGFKAQVAAAEAVATNMTLMRHEIQVIATRLTISEKTQLTQAGDISDLKVSHRDLRVELADLKIEFLARFKELETELAKAQ